MKRSCWQAGIGQVAAPGAGCAAPVILSVAKDPGAESAKNQFHRTAHRLRSGGRCRPVDPLVTRNPANLLFPTAKLIPHPAAELRPLDAKETS